MFGLGNRALLPVFTWDEPFTHFVSDFLWIWNYVIESVFRVFCERLQVGFVELDVDAHICRLLIEVFAGCD